MKEATRILIVEDKPADADLAKYTIQKVLKDCEFQVVETRKDFLNALEVFQPDVILSDYSLPRFDGMKALKLTLEHAPLVPLIIWTGSISEDVAVECMKAGANNYILKENIKRLGPAVIHALEERQLLLERTQVEEKYRNIIENSLEGIFQSTPEGRFVNVNPAMARIYGYHSPEEMIESVKSISNQIYVDHHRRNEFLRILNSEAIVENYEERNYRKDGSIIWTSTSARTVRDTHGNVRYYEGFIQDITQRKEAEKALQDSEKRFRALIENGLDNISLLTVDGTLIWESPAAIRMLEYAPDEFVGRDIFALMHPDDLDWTRDLYAKLIQHPGSHQRGTFRLRRSDGTWRWVDAIVTNMLNEPSVNAIVVNYRDITDQKQAEEALRESQNKLNYAQRIAHVGHFEQDLETGIIAMSDENYRILGLQPREHITISDGMERIHPEDRAKVAQALSDAIHTDQHFKVEYRIVRPDGEERFIYSEGGVNRDDSDHPSLAFGIAQDITERKRVEENLRYSENRYRLVTKATNDVIWEWNPKSSQLLWSENAQHVFGYPPEEIGPGEKWWDDHLHPDDRKRVLPKLDALIVGNESIWKEEYRFLLKDGSYAYISDRGYIERDENGEPIRIIGAMSNITSRKEAEIERQALLEIMQGLANTTDLQELLQLIHHSIAKVIYARNFFVVLYKEEDGLFEEIYSVDQYDPPAPPDKLEKSITSYVFRSGEPLLLTQERFDKLVEQGEALLVGTNSASWLGVPLKTSGRTIGVIAVQDYENDNRYSERDKEFLASIASQIALAIERKQADIELKQKNDDLGLLHAINKAIVRGQNLDSMVELLANELSRIFSIQGSTVYSTLFLLSSDKQSIRLQKYVFSSEVANKIEKLIGFSLPMIEIPVKEGGFFHQAMNSKRSAITTGYQGIRSWITEFTETKFIPPLAKTAVRKLIPQIHKLLNINSMIMVPLISEEETIGFLGVSGSGYFTVHDQKRIENIAGQLTAVIQWQRAEEDLRTSNERFNLMSKAVNDAVWDWDLATGQKRWNDAIHALFKYEPDKVGTDEKWWFKSIHPDDRERILNSVQDVINSKTASNWKNEYRFRRADGSYAFIFDRGHIIRDGSKKAIRMVGAMQDITERKQAEEALHKSEALYRQAMEVAGAVPYYESYYDEGRLIKYDFIGEGIRQITGYGPEEFNAKIWDSLVEEVNLIEDLAGYSLDEGIRRVRAGENSIWKCEHRLRDREGNIHWVFEAAVELRDENGVSHGSIGTYQDITARKQAEEAEREQRVLAEALRDTAETLSSSLSYEEVLDHILAAVGRVVPHDAATVMLIEGGFAHVVRSYGYDQRGFDFEIMGIRLSLAETNNLQQMLETRQPVIVYDTHSYPGWRRLDATDWLCSNVGAPISIHDKVIGFILLDSQTPRFFTAVHAERLEAFANQAALAIHNAHLLQQAQQEIAERKQAEASLAAEREKAKKYLDIAGVMMLALDRDGIVTLINQKGCEILGYSTDEIVGKDWINTFLPRAVRSELQGVFQQLISGNVEPVGYHENTVLTKHGEERLIAWHNIVVRDRQGTIVNTLSSGEDITERKQAEAQLRASEERFRQLAENIEEAFWMTDAESDEEIYISPAAEVIWERPMENLLREPNAFINSVFSEDQPAVLQAIEKEKMGEKAEIEYRIVRPDGSVRWVWDRAFPIFDDTGKVKRIAGLTADITERRESEIALLKSQSRYRELFDSSPISIWEEDYSLVKKRIDLLFERGVKDLKEYLLTHPDEVTELASLVKVTDVNKASLELYQVEHKEDLLNNLTQVMDSEPLSHFEEEILGLVSPLKRFVWEGADKTINGTQMEVIVYGSIPDGYEEDWSKVIVSIIDITERRQAERQLRKLSRAVEQSASTIVITDTTGNIEYVNPKFTQITGYSAEEVIGQNPRILKSGSTPQEVYQQLWETVIAGREWHGELLNKKKNAELYWEYVTISPILNERGEITHFVGAKEDITQRKQSEVETQRHLTDLEALYENGLAVGRLLKTNEIGNRVINTFARYLQWHHVTIRLRKEESDDLELVAFNLPGLNDEERAEMERHFAAHINNVGQGLSGWVIQTGIPFRTGNVLSHPQYVDTQAGIQSGLYMPLKVGERVIGVISVESEMPNAFTEQDERLLATLANQAAIAFENARLYEAVQKELSERKRAEQALRASEVHYRELADSITDILFELDQDLRHTHWNKASEVFSGIPAEEAIGKSIQEVFGTSEEQFQREEIYKSVLKERQARTFETEILAKGQKRALEINAYPSARGVSVVAKDVTERKRSEIIMQKRFELMEFSAHHSLNELMQKTIDEVIELTDSSIGFLHFVNEDQVTLGLQTWSTSALQLFHVPASEGEHLPLDQAGVWAEAARQRHPLIQNDYESLSKRKRVPQGHVPITRELVIPIIRNERLMAIIGIANKLQDYTPYDLEIAARLADYAWDITERKQMELALQAERNQLAQRVDERTADLSRANSNLARALRVKDEFLANMSHELRTPLNAILGLSESLNEQIAGPLNQKQQKYISTISESGHHLLSLINDILDLAKIDAGQITLDINKVDVHSVCQSSLRMIKQLAQKKNQEVSLEIDDGLGLMWADERRLKQMLVNLLGNAVKFTPENGKLGLEVHGDEEANKISFTVWDKGVGIKEEDLARLFQPFVQLDSGLAREATGTGLGLALVAQMARLHGGSIQIVSEPENGSRFTIVLPWEPALAMDAATRMKITGKFRAIKLDEKNKPSILLVEDTQEVTMMVKDYLELAGYKVVTAQDGVDAIVQAKLVRPDLILMDVQMPRMDGLEATRKLRSEPEFRYTPIIALTALAMSGDRARCLEAGMDEYISKPINLKALIKIIQGCLFSSQEIKSQ